MNTEIESQKSLSVQIKVGIEMVLSIDERKNEAEGQKKLSSGGNINLKKSIVSVCAPQYVMRPELQSTCHYIVNHYVNMWHVSQGCR